MMAPHGNRHGRKVVFATIGSLGDVYPFVALAIELQQRGYEPVIATLPCHRHAVEMAGVSFRELRPALGLDDAAFMQPFLASREGLDELTVRYLFPRMRETYADLVACFAGAAAAIVGSLVYPAPLAAEATGTPWASALLAPAFGSAVRDPSPTRLLSRLGRAGLVANAAILRTIRAATRVPGDQLNQVRSRMGRPRRNPGVRVQASSRLVLGLFSRVLGEPQAAWPKATRITGFVPYDAPGRSTLPEPVERFLAAGTPPIVFTLGSAAVLHPGSFFEASLAASRSLGRRAILLTGSGWAPGALPPEVLCLPAAPHSLLFPRCAAIVHQGGIGTLGKALQAGRPMLVVPQFLDQPDNAARARRVGVARIIHSSSYSAGQAAAELSCLLDDARYRVRAEQVARTVRLERGARTAGDAIEHMIAAAAADAKRPSPDLLGESAHEPSAFEAVVPARARDPR